MNKEQESVITDNYNYIVGGGKYANDKNSAVEDIKETVSNLVPATTKKEQAKDNLKEDKSALSSSVQQVGDVVSNTLTDTYNYISGKSEEVSEKAENRGDEAKSGAKDALNDADRKAGELADQAVEKKDELKKSAKSVANDANKKADNYINKK